MHLKAWLGVFSFFLLGRAEDLHLLRTVVTSVLEDEVRR